MKVTIHKGTKQIGGCVTEILTKKARVFIDLGADLTKDQKKARSELEIPGLTRIIPGDTIKNYLLITHYHGDHTGRIDQAQENCSIYMGNTAKKILEIKAEELEGLEKALELGLIQDKEDIEKTRKTIAKAKEELKILRKVNIFMPEQPVPFDCDDIDITITPYMVDHSAYDAYSFLIEADNQSVFYTGDFRLHGKRGEAMLENGFYEKIKDGRPINCLICEGTNISRPKLANAKGELIDTETKLEAKAEEYFNDKKYKYVFILCSSTNIDRILTFYNAYKKSNAYRKLNRPFICDQYQKKILNVVKENHSYYPELYVFEDEDIKVWDEPEARKKRKIIETPNGCCWLIRGNGKSIERRLLEKYRKLGKKENCEVLIIYSEWNKYLDISDCDKRNDNHITLLDGFMSNVVELHTSGHAYLKDIKKLIDIIDPELVVPIHTEHPEAFESIFGKEKVNILEDKEILELPYEH